jgi:hypothetical protein
MTQSKSYIHFILLLYPYFFVLASYSAVIVYMYLNVGSSLNYLCLLLCIPTFSLIL